MTIEELDKLRGKGEERVIEGVRVHVYEHADLAAFGEELIDAYPALRSALLAAKAYLDAFDGDNGPSIVEHEAREALRAKLSEIGL